MPEGDSYQDRLMANTKSRWLLSATFLFLSVLASLQSSPDQVFASSIRSKRDADDDEPVSSSSGSLKNARGARFPSVKKELDSGDSEENSDSGEQVVDPLGHSRSALDDTSTSTTKSPATSGGSNDEKRDGQGDKEQVDKSNEGESRSSIDLSEQSSPNGEQIVLTIHNDDDNEASGKTNSSVQGPSDAMKKLISAVKNAPNGTSVRPSVARVASRAPRTPTSAGQAPSAIKTGGSSTRQPTDSQAASSSSTATPSAATGQADGVSSAAPAASTTVSPSDGKKAGKSGSKWAKKKRKKGKKTSISSGNLDSSASHSSSSISISSSTPKGLDGLKDELGDLEAALATTARPTSVHVSGAAHSTPAPEWGSPHAAPSTTSSAHASHSAHPEGAAAHDGPFTYTPRPASKPTESAGRHVTLVTTILPAVGPLLTKSTAPPTPAHKTPDVAHRQNSSPPRTKYKEVEESDKILAVVITNKGGFKGRRLNSKAIELIMRGKMGFKQAQGTDSAITVSRNNTYVFPAGQYYFPNPIRFAGFVTP